MKTADIYKWAVKGLQAEIDNLEKDISKGKQFLAEYEKGGKPKTPKTPQEIKEIIQQKQAEIEKLDKMRFNLEFEISNPE